MPKVIENQAEVSYQYSQVTGNVSSNIVATHIKDEYMIEAKSRSLQATYNPNDTITIVIEIENMGSEELSNLTIKDDLGRNCQVTYQDNSLVTYKNSIEVKSNATIEEHHLIIKIPEKLQPNDKYLVLYCIKVNAFPDLFLITTTQTISAQINHVQKPIITFKQKPTITIYREQFTQLDMAKNVQMKNHTLTYIFEITNVGNMEASHIVLVDWLQNNFKITTIIMETNGTTIPYYPHEYHFNHKTGKILLPCISTKPITVPAATHTSPGRTMIYIKGTII